MQATYAFDAATGGLVWQRAISPGFIIFSSPTVANGVLYVASSLDASATHFDGKLYAVDAATGDVLFSDVVSAWTRRSEMGQCLADS